MVRGEGEGVTEHPVHASSGPLITLNYRSDAWPVARVLGVLTEREGCLLIGSDIAVFPVGTVWAGPDVVFEDGTIVTVGMQVDLCGGYYELATVTGKSWPVMPMARVQACARRVGATGFVWAMP